MLQHLAPTRYFGDVLPGTYNESEHNSSKPAVKCGVGATVCWTQVLALGAPMKAVLEITRRGGVDDLWRSVCVGMGEQHDSGHGTQSGAASVALKLRRSVCRCCPQLGR